MNLFLNYKLIDLLSDNQNIYIVITIKIKSTTAAWEWIGISICMYVHIHLYICTSMHVRSSINLSNSTQMIWENDSYFSIKKNYILKTQKMFEMTL